MRTLHKAARVHRARHVVFSAGGTHAFLNGSGTMFACWLAGAYKWDSIGGISGGSIPALLTAAGVHPREIVRRAVSTDFSELLVQHDTFGSMIKHRLFRKDKSGRMLRHGIVRSEGLGKHLEQVVGGEWPDKFWTMAVAGRRVLLFTKQGVFLYRKGRCRQLTNQPAPISLAIRASCAVPGIVEAVEYEKYVLFDGALSKYGMCPTEMASIHFGAERDDILAVDLVRHSGSRRARFVEALARVLSGTLRQRPKLPFVTHAGLVVRTEMEDFNSLEFDIPTELKQRAVLAGFRTACEELLQSGIMEQEQYDECFAKSETWSDFDALLKSTEEVQYAAPLNVEQVNRRRWWQFWRR